MQIRSFLLILFACGVAHADPQTVAAMRGNEPQLPPRLPPKVKLEGSTEPAEGDQVALPARIDAIEIEKLSYTKRFVVLREIGVAVGDDLTEDRARLAVDRLWNTPLFRNVDLKLVRKKGKNVLVIVADDRFPINPLFEFELGGQSLWFHVGASYRNALGRYLEMEVLYEYFNGEHGGRVWFRDPRFLGDRQEIKFEAQRLMRTRPDWLVRRAGVRAEYNKLFARDYVKLGARLGVFADTFFPPHHEDAAMPSASLPSIMRFIELEPGARVGRLNRRGVLRQGLEWETRFAVGATTRTNAETYAYSWSQLVGFWIPKEPFEIGGRIKGGIMTTAPDQLHYFLGGLETVRGFPDNYIRTRQYFAYNAEIKVRLFETKWLAMLVGAFTDGAVAAPRTPFGQTQLAFSAGLSAMFILPFIADSELRLDFAIPLNRPVVLESVPNVGSAPFF